MEEKIYSCWEWGREEVYTLREPLIYLTNNEYTSSAKALPGAVSVMNSNIKRLSTHKTNVLRKEGTKDASRRASTKERFSYRFGLWLMPNSSLTSAITWGPVFLGPWARAARNSILFSSGACMSKKGCSVAILSILFLSNDANPQFI